ncbi:hypothetical protein DFS34DRAFT_661674 [Phlyctochytrium arcticum]|nr:hypothetical protein DFS34DRAFT_661674 [Phlyctochytrium arcticum]
MCVEPTLMNVGGRTLMKTTADSYPSKFLFLQRPLPASLSASLQATRKALADTEPAEEAVQSTTQAAYALATKRAKRLGELVNKDVQPQASLGISSCRTPSPERRTLRIASEDGTENATTDVAVEEEEVFFGRSESIIALGQVALNTAAEVEVARHFNHDISVEDDKESAKRSADEEATGSRKKPALAEEGGEFDVLDGKRVELSVDLLERRLAERRSRTKDLTFGKANVTQWVLDGQRHLLQRLKKGHTMVFDRTTIADILTISDVFARPQLVE